MYSEEDMLMLSGIQNYRNILRRYIRDYCDIQEVDDAVRVLDANKLYALHAEDKAKLMGFEGIASNSYFEVLPKLILNQKESFPFNGRQKRLRKVAKACLDYGQRVQNSVFECEVTEVQLCLLKERIKGIIEKSLDSIRFYHLNRNENRRVEVLGIETAYNVNDAIIV